MRRLVAMVLVVTFAVGCNSNSTEMPATPIPIERTSAPGAVTPPLETQFSPPAEETKPLLAQLPTSEPWIRKSCAGEVPFAVDSGAPLYLAVTTADGDGLVDLATGVLMNMPRQMQGGYATEDGRTWFLPRSRFAVFRAGTGVSTDLASHESLWAQELADGRFAVQELPANGELLTPAEQQVFVVNSDGHQEANAPTLIRAPDFFAEGIPAFISNFLFDPAYTRIVYGWEDLNRHRGMRIWHMSESRVLWEQTWASDIFWSGYDWNEDSTLAISIPMSPSVGSDPSLPEIVLIGPEGEETLISRFRDSVHAGQLYRMQELSWSPNGSDLAVVFTADLLQPYTSKSLHLVDTVSQGALDTCISLGFGDLHWSPSGEWLAFLPEVKGSVGILNVRENTWTRLALAGGGVREIKGWLEWKP